MMSGKVRCRWTKLNSASGCYRLCPPAFPPDARVRHPVAPAGRRASAVTSRPDNERDRDVRR